VNIEYFYYQEIIKPLEAKYNTYTKLYEIFKFNYLKKKSIYYNSLLNCFYSLIKDNNNYLNNFTLHLSNSK